MSILENRDIKHVVISRIDALGDAILTLPACIYLRMLYPNIIISFLGRTYTRPVIEACSAIDHFINYDEILAMPLNEQIQFVRDLNADAIVHTFPTKHIAFLFKRADVRIRIGTTSKNYHFFTCNKLLRLSRRNSDLHEAQQNIFLLKPLGINHVPTLGSIACFYTKYYRPKLELPAQLAQYFKSDKFNLIIHSKSNGNGLEWDREKYTKLIKKLPADKFNILITGSPKEHDLFKDWIPVLPSHVTDVSGKMSVEEMVAFIYRADGLLASGTGPLHIAAASGIHTLGVFPTTRSINAPRWAPVGRKAEHIESNSCGLDSITVDVVYERIMNWLISDKRITFYPEHVANVAQYH